MGFKRTLTLVNGRRHVAGIEGTAAVDISTIPAALIDRVDVLSGGASAVYGADALTGVVNVILKDDFEGVEFGVQKPVWISMATIMPIAFRSPQVKILGGSGNITFSAQVESDNGLLQGQRSFLADNALLNDDANPALRFQQGDISAGDTPNLAEFYNFANTGRFGWGLRIPSEETFTADYTDEFGAAPSLTEAEKGAVCKSS